MQTKQLLEQLTGADEELRAQAQEELAHRMDDSIAGALLEIASSGASDEIRSDAIISLGPVIETCGMDYDEEFDSDLDSDAPVSRETFQKIMRQVTALYSDESQPKLVRRRAFEVLIRDPQPGLAVDIRRHFASSDEEWKRTAVFAMGMITGFEREIAATVKEGEGSLLYEAVRAAGRMEVTAAAKKIRELATSDATDHDLRVVAILALPDVDRDSAELLEQLTEDPDEEIAEVAEEALEELNFRERIAGSLEGDDE